MCEVVISICRSRQDNITELMTLPTQGVHQTNFLKMRMCISQIFPQFYLVYRISKTIFLHPMKINIKIVSHLLTMSALRSKFLFQDFRLCGCSQLSGSFNLRSEQYGGAVASQVKSLADHIFFYKPSPSAFTDSLQLKWTWLTCSIWPQAKLQCSSSQSLSDKFCLQKWPVNFS